MGGGQKEVARLEDFIHIPITMKGLIPSLLEILGWYEEPLCPFEDWKRKKILRPQKHPCPDVPGCAGVETGNAFQPVYRTLAQIPPLPEELDPMAKHEKIVERHDDRISFLLGHPNQMTRKPEEMLKVNEVGSHLFEGLQEDGIHKRVVVKTPGAIDPGQTVDHPPHPQPLDPLLIGREFLSVRIFAPAEDRNVMTDLSQCLGKVEGVELHPRILFRRKPMADLKDLH
jgi:hypothetical protein